MGKVLKPKLKGISLADCSPPGGKEKTKCTVGTHAHYTWCSKNSTHSTHGVQTILSKWYGWLRVKLETFLLSSSTVFMFSIQTASTGPSNKIHLRVSVKLDAYSRNVFASTPTCTQIHRYTTTYIPNRDVYGMLASNLAG